MVDLVFLVAVAALLAHEMDAVDKREWRLLFGLRRLPDAPARQWFVGLHVPLFVALLALVAAGPSSLIRGVEGAVDGFMVVHAGLHERLAGRSGRDFANRFSRWLFWTAALLGVVHGALLVSGVR